MKPHPEAAPQVHVFTPYYPPAYLGGGPIRTIEAMVTSSRDMEAITVFTTASDHGGDEVLDVPHDQLTRYQGARVWYGAKSPLGTLRALMASRMGSPTTIYLNSVLHPTFAVLPLLLHKLHFWRSANVILAPRGELDPAALSHKATKKNFYLNTARRLGLFRKATWHASSTREARAICTRLPDARIVVKENETALPREAVFHRPPSSPKRDVQLLYVGRISPEKQLDLLLRALSDPENSDLHLHIVGEAIDQKYERRVMALAEPIKNQITWHGAQEREQVLTFFEQADYACFPTGSENFGHAISEALSRACPVIVMDVTPWTPWIKKGGGILVEAADPKTWANALRALDRDAESIITRKLAAAETYSSWRSSTDTRSFLDYVIDQELHALTIRARSAPNAMTKRGTQ